MPDNRSPQSDEQPSDEPLNSHDATPGAPSDGEQGITPQAVRREVRDFLRAHERRRRQIPRAALVGLVAGLVAVAFHWVLDAGAQLRNSLIVYAHAHSPWGVLLPIAFSAAGGGGAVWLVRRVAPEASGSGIPQLKAVLHRLRRMKWQRIIPVKFVGGFLAIGGGLALGREGPTVQMGSAIGQMVSQWLDTTPRERQTLIAAGAGAGLAAAFNAPLAGLVFVLEEVQRDFSPVVFTVAFVAAVTADVVGRLLTGQLPVFHAPFYPVPPLTTLPLFLVLGVLTGLLGVAFNRALLGTLNLFGRAGHWAAGTTGLLVGAGVGLLGWFAPGALGGGHELVVETLSGRTALQMIPVLFLLRFALTVFSYGCGAPGGIFAPLLVLGALIGLSVGEVSQWLFPRVVEHPEAFAVVGMAAYFTAIVRAPLTGIVLIVEMTNNYEQMLPLLVACLSAYAVADLLSDLPIYEALLERDLLRSQDNPQLEGSLLLELTVQPGAPFDGKRVHELGLPPGCVLVALRHGIRDQVPMPDTRLEAGDHLTAVVAPQAARAVALLHEGVEPVRAAPRHTEPQHT
jgi:chloride channel protein, CIC family